MLQLNISTRPIRLEYDIRHPQLNLRTIPPQLQMKTDLPKVEMRQPRGELTIDQTPCRYSIERKNIADFMRDNVNQAKQIAFEGIARIALEGRQMANIHHKVDAIAEIAAESTRPEFKEITLNLIQPPIIRYIAQPVQFNPIAGKVHFAFQPGEVHTDFQRGEVNIQVVQYPSINISVVDIEV